MESGILVSTPDLRPSLYSILKGLDEVSLLKEVVTTVAFDPRRMSGKCMKNIRKAVPPSWRKGIEKRIVPDFLSGKTKSISGRELVRLMTNKLGNNIFAHRVWLWSELSFDREVARRFSGRFRCIYGMEHSSLETFTRQKNLGGLCLLRAVTTHIRAVINTMRREIEKFPEAARSYSLIFQKDIERASVRKEAEHGFADLIVTNSHFTKESFIEAGIDAEKIIAVPTGCPPCSGILSNSGKGKKPLVFLFVGKLSLWKGVPYLLKSWRLLKPGRAAELWLVGQREISLTHLSADEDNIRYFGPLSKSRLAKIYEQADVLVLPTLFEGLAHVVLEALSYGMPVITTRESGCGDFVRDGHNGFIIRRGDTQALCEALARCLEHRRELPGMGMASTERARSWTVTDSNRAHLAAIQEFLKKKDVE